MDLINDYRNPKHILAILKLIKKEVRGHIKIMEICGGHTHSIMKFGILELLPKEIEFIHGPGCPVCVIPKERIDHAIALASMDGVILATLGDMIRVPGSRTSLQKLRAEGRDIRALYSPLDVIDIAKENPDKKVIFFAIGFETTTPMTAVIVQMAIKQNIKNLFFHINHVSVPEPVLALMSDDEVQIDAFIAPSHVSVITGYKIYEEIAKKFNRPITVGGFEPIDIMESILDIVRQINLGVAQVHNQYSRVVTKDGNIKALELIYKYFRKRDSFVWRGMGPIPKSGLKLKEEFAYLDAEVIYSDILPHEVVNDHKLCICGEILKGKAKPYDCKVFAKGCSPLNPMGACMVSGEGACAAYYKFAKARL